MLYLIKLYAQFPLKITLINIIVTLYNYYFLNLKVKVSSDLIEELLMQENN